MFGMKLALTFVLLTMAFRKLPLASAQESSKSENGAQALATGTFHGKVHKTSGRATIYQTAGGKLVLRLTNFKTLMGRTSMWC